jgi:hypothetical protein
MGYEVLNQDYVVMLTRNWRRVVLNMASQGEGLKKEKVGETGERTHKVLSPNINLSRRTFHGVDIRMRSGLLYIHSSRVYNIPCGVLVEPGWSRIKLLFYDHVSWWESWQSCIQPFSEDAASTYPHAPSVQKLLKRHPTHTSVLYARLRDGEWGATPKKKY